MNPAVAVTWGSFVAAGGDPQTAVVALRGTVSAAEWWDDLHWDLVPFTQVPDGGKVARGFRDIYGTDIEVVEVTVNEGRKTRVCIPL